MSTEHDEVLYVLDQLETLLHDFEDSNLLFTIEDFIKKNRAEYGDPKEYM